LLRGVRNVVEGAIQGPGRVIVTLSCILASQDCQTANQDFCQHAAPFERAAAHVDVRPLGGARSGNIHGCVPWREPRSRLPPRKRRSRRICSRCRNLTNSFETGRSILRALVITEPYPTDASRRATPGRFNRHAGCRRAFGERRKSVNACPLLATRVLRTGSGRRCFQTIRRKFLRVLYFE